jgi:type I restriction enzyme S subunit
VGRKILAFPGEPEHLWRCASRRNLLPFENPKGYPIHELEETCSRITDGTHQPPRFTEEGIPFLFVRNIVSGSIDFDTEKFITEETFAELTRRVKPERGDILYSTVGSFGVAVLVETDRKFAFQRHIGHLKPNRQIDSGFLTAQPTRHR